MNIETDFAVDLIAQYAHEFRDKSMTESELRSVFLNFVFDLKFNTQTLKTKNEK